VAQRPVQPCSRCRRALVPGGVSLCRPCEARHGRGTATERGYDHAWRKLRREHAEAHPFCAPCLGRGHFIPVEIVDHITPHLGNDALRLNPGNLQSLCRSCHSRKTHAEGEGYVAPRH
jgi:5-methylcytosine-specific restriction protein A